jgi:hypothetical protein
MAKSKKSGLEKIGPIKAIQSQPTTSLWLMLGGAVIGLVVAKMIPAVRNVFGLSGLSAKPVQWFKCPLTGKSRPGCGPDCWRCWNRWSCPTWRKGIIYE